MKNGQIYSAQDDLASEEDKTDEGVVKILKPCKKGAFYGLTSSHE
ncbi:MAG: hypothetical protein QXU18_10635 [Thermoplasmatales archaeon]